MKKFLLLLLLVGVSAAQQIDPSQIKAGSFTSKMGFNAGLCDLLGASDLKHCYGAPTDGSNAATAINAAMVSKSALGGIIAVPEATFTINAATLSLQNNTLFVGRGPNSKFVFTGTAPTITCGTAPSDSVTICSNGKTSVGFVNMTLDFTASTAHSSIIQDSASSKLTLKYVNVVGQATDTGSGPSGYIWLFGNGNELSTNSIDNIQAILVQQSSDCNIHDNYFYHYRTGVYLKGVTSPSYRGCVVKDNHYVTVGGVATLAAVGFDSVLVEMSQGLTISGNIVTANREHAIYVAPYNKDVIIDNNNITGCLANGCIQIRGNNGGAGTGYNENITLTNNTVRGAGTFATATSTLTGGAVSAVNVTYGGAGYFSAPQVTFTGGGTPSVAATATANLNGAGQVVSVTVTNGGVGYSSPPTVGISGSDIGYLLQGIRGLSASNNKAFGMGSHGFYINNCLGCTFGENQAFDNQADGFAITDDVGPNQDLIFNNNEAWSNNRIVAGLSAGFHIGLNNGYASSNVRFNGNVSSDRAVTPTQVFGFKFDNTTAGSSITDVILEGNSGVGNTGSLYSTNTPPTGYTNLSITDVLNGTRTTYTTGGIKVAPTQNTTGQFTSTFGNASTTAGTYGQTINMGSADPTTLGFNVQFNGVSGFRVFGDHIASSGTGVSTFAGPLTVAGAMTLSNVSGLTQCLHVNSSGLVTGSGADCGIGSGGGLADPGGNGPIKRTALNVTAPAISSDIYGLWAGTCNASSFLRGDGTCAAPAGSGNTTSTALTTGYIPKASGANSIVNSSIDDGATTANTVTITASAGVTAPKFTATTPNSGLDLTEGTGAALTPQAGHDICWADSTAHRPICNSNNGGNKQIVMSGTDINSSDQVTATHLVSALPGAQGGLNANAAGFTGVLREASGTASASELSGDVTTSGSNVVTVSKVNGTSVPTNAAADQSVVTTASATGSWASLPNCGDATHGLAYSTSTHTYSCQSITGTAGGVADPGGNGIINRTALNTTAPATGHNVAAILDCIAASASGTAYTCSTSPTFTPATGDKVLFKADVANTGSATVNVNSSSAVTIKKQGGGTNLVANDLLAGQWSQLVYDGTNWQMQGQLGNAPAGGGSITVNGSGSATNLSDSTPAAPIATKPGAVNVNFQISGANASGYVNGLTQRYIDRRYGVFAETGTSFAFSGSETQVAATLLAHTAPSSTVPFPYAQAATNTTINTIAGIGGASAWQRGSSGHPTNLYFSTRVALLDNSAGNQRVCIGLLSTTIGTSCGSDTPTAHAAYFRFSTAVGNNWYCVTSDGSTVNAQDTSVNATTDANFHKFEIAMDDSGTGTVHFFFDGVEKCGGLTSNLPGTTTNLSGQVSIWNLTGANRRFQSPGIYEESNY